MEPTPKAAAALERLRPREIEFANLMGRRHSIAALDTARTVLRQTRMALETGSRRRTT